MLVEVGVGESVGVFVFVGVDVRVAVGGFVGVGVKVEVGVLVGVLVETGAEVGLGVEVAVEQEFIGEEELRGVGAPAAKSVELLSVSVQPFAARKIAFVLLGAGATTVSKQFALLPYPTRSTTPVGHCPLNAMELFTSATFPAVAFIAIVPIASGVGKLIVPPVPAAC